MARARTVPAPLTLRRSTRGEEGTRRRSAVKFAVGAEDAPLVERNSPLRLQIGGNARTLGHGIVQLDQARHLLLEALHAFGKRVAQPLDDLEQAQIDVTDRAPKHVGAAAVREHALEIAQQLWHAIAPELPGVALRRRSLILIVERR